jgi:aminopeptidase YwaD
LAGDEFGGRRVGTPGGRAAAGWVADRLRALGAVVTTEEFSVAGAVKELYATPMLRMRRPPGGAGLEAGRQLVHRRDFCEHLTSADVPDPRRGRVVRGDETELAGAWMLETTASPERVEELAAAGALGVLVPRGTDEAGWMPKMIGGPPAAALPVLALRADLHDKVRDDDVIVEASVPLRTVDVVGTNVHGTFRSPAADAPSVLLTAHFDGVGDDPETRFPAAADNASGVAVVLEAARLLHETLDPRVGLAVAALDAEEAGAHGSAHHAPKVAAGTYVINVDGAAALDEAAAVEAGGPAHPLLAALDQAGRQVGVPLRAGAMASDNRRYAAAGLPAVGIGMGLPGYQTPAETPDRVDPETLVTAARLVVATVHELARNAAPLSSIADQR